MTDDTHRNTSRYPTNKVALRERGAGSPPYFSQYAAEFPGTQTRRATSWHNETPIPRAIHLLLERWAGRSTVEAVVDAAASESDRLLCKQKATGSKEPLCTSPRRGLDIPSSPWI